MIWNDYVEYFKYNAISRKAEYFLQNGYTNMVFVTADAGSDLYIFFNTDIFDESEVMSVISNIIESNSK